MQLSTYIQLFRSQWLAIFIATLLGLALSAGWAYLQPPQYTADATAIVTTGVSQDLGSALVGDNYAKSRVKSYLTVAESRTVAEYAAKELNVTSSPESLIGDVTVSNPTDTAVLAITARARTPQAARALAEAWISGMIKQVDDLENAGKPAIDADTGATAASVVKLQTLDTAALPTQPSSPNWKQALASGILLGLLVGIGYALIRKNLDRRIRSVESVEKGFGLAVIGTVPHNRNFTDTDRLVTQPGATASRSRNTDDDMVSEAMRELRSNLQFMNVDNPPRIIVITSSLPGDGKSTIAVNLALTIAAGGQRVIIMDGDLRRPSVAKSFNLIEGVGLTDVLIGRVEINDVLQPWGESGNLFVMGSGSIPPNPSELLGSKAMSTLINDLATRAIVIIDAPPLIPVTDAAVLTAISHGALVVASVGKTTTDALEKALGNIERVKGRTLGIILNRVPRRGAGSAHYGYQYTGTYSAIVEKAPTALQPQIGHPDFESPRRSQMMAAPANPAPES